MQLPPENIPAGLSSREYKKLGLLYALMGKQEEAVECMTRDLEQAAQEDLSPTSAADDTDPGGQLGTSLLKLINSALVNRQSQSKQSENPDQDEQLNRIEEQLAELGVSSDQAAGVITDLKQKLADLASSEPPPRDVPQGLSCQQYYQLGLKYKECGWTEQARDALQLAIEIAPTSNWGVLARRFLGAKIPRHPVPLVAEQTNIQGFNLLFSGKLEEAKSTFEILIAEYPDFEWPYGNLGSLLIRQGKIGEAIEVLKKAVDLNHDYINAWLHMARGFALLGLLSESHACLDRILEIDPDDTAVGGLRAMLVELESL
ncbi:MAG: tetratricopeptide repeat protein [Candidatus Obscuribacterales bacterium]|nr:tetratricopeptide repeat protein [Candidatus Obscuribacterales bacterium]